MGSPRIIARVVDAGECRYYEKGREFTLSGFTPKGLCDSAYVALSRDAQTLRYGGELPWQRDGRVLTRCPDPNGALWELTVQSSPESERPDSARKVERPKPEDGSAGPPQFPGGMTSTWELSACEGAERGCPFVVADPAGLDAAIGEVIAGSGWEEFVRRNNLGPVLPHRRLRVALAGCPNGCSQPQIQDFGVIARLRPESVTDDCTGCGACGEVCTEDAVRLEGGVARLQADACVGCGLCIGACPVDALETPGVRYTLLAGGKLGRHPVLARQVARALPAGGVPGAVGELLATVLERIGPGQRVAEVLEEL